MTNHGGRQVDGAVGSLEVLPEIVEAVGNSACSRFFLTVVKTRGWYKCGVRARGDDDHLRLGYSHGCRIALGAHVVMVGRLFVWGMSHEGVHGCKHVIKGLLADLDILMTVAGYVQSTRTCSRTRMH